jgi:hypothetical protein
VTRRPRLAAWLLFALYVVFVCAGLAFYVLIHSPFFTFDNTLVLAFTGVAALGLVIALRQPGNALAWVFSAIAVAFGVLAFADGYTQYTLVEHPGALPGGRWVGWLYGWWWFPMLVSLVTLPFLLFPDGRLPGQRWKPVLVATVALAAVGWVPASLYPVLENLPARNPLGLRGAKGVLDAVNGIEFLALAVLGCAAAASLVVRFRRATSVERQQLKWVIFAGGLLVAFVAGALIAQAAGAPPVPDGVLGLILGVLPASVGVAMLRYRLYDIDVVINRALVYGSLTGLLALSYLGLVLVLQVALRPLVPGSGLAVALSTLAVAALFQPLRRRLQDAVDRRFYRRKYDAERTLQSFAARLRHGVDVDELRSELGGVVAETMQPSHVSHWVRSAT